jgi:hypothetical protein
VDRDDVDRLITRADLDALVRAVDGCVTEGDWDGLVALRDACRWAAGDTGRQLWPVASLASYRLALDAPGPWASAAATDETATFVFGPLTEVAASTHAWRELGPHLTPSPAAAFVAHERVVRGEDLRGEPIAVDVLDLPLVLQPWEPSYAVAEYEATEARFPPPPLPGVAAVQLRSFRPAALDDDHALDALRGVVAAWVTGSNGRCDVAAVEGDHLDALAALGVPQARVAELTPPDALAWLAWAGASGGAHGRRRGAARGRFEAWWVVAALSALDWPAAPADVGDAAGELRWFWWDAHEPLTGWRLQLAAWDPADGVAFAVAASDAA